MRAVELATESSTSTSTTGIWSSTLAFSGKKSVKLATESSATTSTTGDWSSTLVMASIAVHPPKFKQLRQFLEELAMCPAARRALFVYVVLENEADLVLFRQELSNSTRNSTLPDVWAPTLAYTPKELWSVHDPAWVSSFKKWHGIATMLDMGASAPEYGLIMDAELGLFNTSDCGADSHWNNFAARIKAHEASKGWPAVRSTGKAKHILSRILNASATWVTKGGLDACSTPECKALKEQIGAGLYSWWTELPYVNLRVAGNLLFAMAGTPMSGVVPGPLGYWQAMLRSVLTPPFEHLCYQQWCVLHEGYRIRDVTDLVGVATFHVSYLEGMPAGGGRLAELHPMWLSELVAGQARTGVVAALSATEPPLLLFHTDRK